MGVDGCPHVVYRPTIDGDGGNSELELASFDGQEWKREPIPNSNGARSPDIWFEPNGLLAVAWSNPESKVVRLGVRRAPNDWIVQDIVNDWVWGLRHIETPWHDRALIIKRSDEHRSIQTTKIYMLVEDDGIWSMHPIADEVLPEVSLGTQQVPVDPATGQAVIFLSTYYIPSKTKHLGNLWIARSAPGSLTDWKAERAPPTGLARDLVTTGYIAENGLMHVFAKERGSGLGTRWGPIYHLSGSPTQGWIIRPFPNCEPGSCRIHSMTVTAQGKIDVFYAYDKTPPTRDTALLWARYDGKRWRTTALEPIAEHVVASVAYEPSSEDIVHILLQQSFDSPKDHSVLIHRLVTVAEFDRENIEDKR